MVFKVHVNVKNTVFFRQQHMCGRSSLSPKHLRITTERTTWVRSKLREQLQDNCINGYYVKKVEWGCDAPLTSQTTRKIIA